MHKTGQIYRPPTEADTPLLEVTSGCTWNKCTFCTMYDKTSYDVSNEEDIIEDLEELKLHNPQVLKRIFLLNGDAFTLSTSRLVRISDLICEYFPGMESISCYASIRSLKNKSFDELELLASKHYDDLYIGIESGSDYVLDLMNKGYTSKDEYENLGKLCRAGISYNALIMLGCGGREHSREHIECTLELLNTFKPHIFAPLSTTVEDGSRLKELVDCGEFNMLTEEEMIVEELDLLKGLDLDDDAYFFGNHVFNTIAANGYFKHKDFIVEYIEEEFDRLKLEKPELMSSVFNTFVKKRGGFLIL